MNIHMGVIYKDEEGKMVLEDLSAIPESITENGLRTKLYDLTGYKDLDVNEYHAALFLHKDGDAYIVRITESFLSMPTYQAMEHFPAEFQEDIERCCKELYKKPVDIKTH